MRMKHSYSTISRCLAAVFAGILTLSLGSCADDNFAEKQEQGDNGVAVRFNVSSAQEEMLQQQAKSAPATRAAIVDRLATQGLTLEDLATRKLEATNDAGLDACLVESTIEGVNPVLPSAQTRANIKTSIDAQFTSLGYRSATQGFAPTTPNWFYDAPTTPTGALVSPLQWSWSARYARFYGIYPEAKSGNKITLSPETHSGTPYLDFEVEQDVKNQKDLMAACSGEVHYATRGTAPESNLKFRHALTAVRFAVGQNLSWNKRIVKVEIKGAYSKGRYTLPTEKDGTGAAVDGAWDASSLADKKDFVLDLSNAPVLTNKNPNTVLTGNDGDNYTFYMIPQQLAGVTVVITLESTHAGSTASNTITVPLKGTWKPGTTKTYKLSQTTSDWTFDITVTTLPPAVAYNVGTTDFYGITSTRTAPDGTKRAVPWKVKEYSFDGGLTWVTDIPANSWFKGLDKTEGGNTFNSVAEERGTASLKDDDVENLLPLRNNALKKNPKGTAANYYDLSMYDIKGNPRATRSTANCYVISHPGYYKLPLVYGNAITNGIDTKSSYEGPSTVVKYNNTDVILHNFKDHAGANITNAWIEKTNNGANNGIDGAKIIWMDEENLVHLNSADLFEGSGGERFLKFEVKADDIKNGNAVVAVTKNNVVVWSWHLWFAPDNVLDKIPVTNHTNDRIYNFTTENLGWKYKTWIASIFQQPRSVMVRVEQLVGNGTKKHAEFTITQNPGSVKIGSNTHYQFGRKDPFPGGWCDITTLVITKETLYPASHSFVQNAGNNMSITNAIQHPGSFYTWGKSWYPYTWNAPAGYSYYNLWSGQNTITTTRDVVNADAVVKTVYDPSPVGFKMPANDAFTRFTTTGKNSQDINELNVQGTKNGMSLRNNYGYNFWTNGSQNATVHFPSSGVRHDSSGSLMQFADIGYYWAAVPGNVTNSSILVFTSGFWYPLTDGYRGNGFSVRPVADE